MLLQELLENNSEYTRSHALERMSEAVHLGKKPGKRCVIFACMDARLVNMVEPALGIQRGDAVVLRNAGNIIGTMQGTMIISLLLAIYMQDIKEIIVVGHDDCGFTNTTSTTLLQKMRASGIDERAVEDMRVPFETYLDPHTDPEENVRHVVGLLSTHPAFPRELAVHGLIMHPDSGAVRHILSAGGLQASA